MIKMFTSPVNTKHSIQDIGFISFLASALYIFDTLIDNSLRFTLSSMYYGQLNYSQLDHGVWVMIKTGCYFGGILLIILGGTFCFSLASWIFIIIKFFKKGWKNKSPNIMLMLIENKVIRPLGMITIPIYLMLLYYNSNFFIGYFYFGACALTLCALLFSLANDETSYLFINLIKIVLCFITILAIVSFTIIPIESWILEQGLALSKTELLYNPQSHLIIDSKCLNTINYAENNLVKQCNNKQVTCFNKKGNNFELLNYNKYISSAKLIKLKLDKHYSLIKIDSCAYVNFIPGN